MNYHCIDCGDPAVNGGNCSICGGERVPTGFDTRVISKRNRMPVPLPVLRIEVEDADGVQTFDPNGVNIWQLDGGVNSLRPVDGFVLYRSHDVEIPLRPKELDRLIRLALTKKLYFAIRAKFGLFYEIHEDFYDPDTGIALQARRGVGERAKH